MRRLLELRIKALGPVAAVPLREALRAGTGAFLALLGAFALGASTAGLAVGFALIAPFGASAVLVFAAVNSPLAQPWPVVLGNTASAAVALGICALLPFPWLAAPLSVAAAIVTMALLRATHPPGGAVALTVALLQAAGTPLGLDFLPAVAAGSLFLVLCGLVWAWLTGRRYPMRQFGAPGPVQTADPPPAERLGLSEAELRGLLAEYRQSLNLGVEDLARLIAGAEQRAVGHRTGATTAQDIMSRDLVVVGPEDPLDKVVEIFARHNFTSLPVVGPDRSFLGVIFQLHLVKALAAAPQAGAGQPLTAAAVMTRQAATATEIEGLGALVGQLAVAGADAVMILEGARLVGVITQTDLLAALAREIARTP